MDVYIRLNKTVDPDGKKEESKKAVWEKAEEVSVLSVQEQMERIHVSRTAENRWSVGKKFF